MNLCMEETNIKIREDWFDKKLDALKEVYNIKTTSKLIQHIVKLEYQRHWL